MFVILVNIITPFFGVWNVFYLIALGVLCLFLLFLVFRKKEDGLFKVVKIMVLIIPVLLIGYIVYSNFIASHEFSYFYDIGSEKDAKKPYLTPVERTSEADLNASLRNITSNLIYFDIPIPKGSDYLIIRAKVQNPANPIISIGAKNKEEWSYFYKKTYNPLLEQTNIQKITTLSDIPEGSTIATDKNLLPIIKEQDFEIKELTIENNLRGEHTFYIYLEDSLNLYAEKKDINWYNGSDEINITLYDLNEKILGQTIIEDDGILDNSNNISKEIIGKLKVENIAEGVYKLEFKGGADTTITKINLNTDKIVTNKIFSADSKNYASNEDKEVSLYTQTEKENLISFQTIHASYFQNISINNKTFELNERAIWISKNLNQGENYIQIPKSNVVILSNNYLTFSKENYFEPFKYYIIDIPTKQKDFVGIDYILTDYIPSKNEGNWTILSAKFDLKDTYIKDGKLNLIFSIPHLAENQNETNKMYVAIDWIDIKVYKDGIFKN